MHREVLQSVKGPTRAKARAITAMVKAKEVMAEGDQAKDLKKVHKEGKADKKLARQLQRAAQDTD